MATEIQVLNEIARGVKELRKAICCLQDDVPETGNSCENPTYTQLCQIEDLTSRLDEMIELLSLTPPVTDYNENSQQEVIGATTVLIPADEYHSVSITIIQGTIDLLMGSTLLEDLPAGFTTKFTADQYLENNISVTGNSPETRAIINLIR